jgi:hypothetical protein
MGASVGVGGLIIGISMLVVFSMAYQAISLQIDSGVDRIEEADEPIPTFTIDDAVISLAPWSMSPSTAVDWDTAAEARLKPQAGTADFQPPTRSTVREP